MLTLLRIWRARSLPLIAAELTCLYISMPLITAVLTCLALCRPLNAAEGARAFPLWDGKETVERYAARVKLAAGKSVDLGGGVKLELVLIPAGEFVMGVPPPVEPAMGVRGSEALFGLGCCAALVVLGRLIIRGIKQRRFNFSLSEWIVFCLMLSVAVWGVTRRHLAVAAWEKFEREKKEYEAIPENQKPGHRVVITKPFYMGKYEVTWEQYGIVIDKWILGSPPEAISEIRRLIKYPRGPYEGKGPAGSIAFADCQAICKRIQEQHKVLARLPTEAEWEYACRAGTTTAFNTGETLNGGQANIWSDRKIRLPLPVGSFPPNAWGLYDMYGNVEEWCSDWYDGAYYAVSPTHDPPGPAAGEFRVVRGGSWIDYARRSTFRSGVAPEENSPVYEGFQCGFRVVVEIE